MFNKAIFTAVLVAGMASASFAGVTISSPANGATVGSPVHFIASATGTYPISSMIIYVDNVNKYLVYASHLDTYMSLPTGKHSVIIKSWDSHGTIYQASESINVGSSTTTTTTSTSGSGVSISSPTSGSTVGSPVHFVASASGSAPISSMIIYVDNANKYLVYANHLDTYLSLANGGHSVIIKAWDNTGKIYQQSESISVGTSTTTTTTTTTTAPSGATHYYNIEQMSGWGSCSQCAGAGGSGPIASYYMWQNQSSPSMDGNSSKYAITGGSAYADVLWWKQLANGSNNPTLVANAHHFIYDTYFYVTNPTAVQALEFDINQFTGGKGYIFGTQCNVRAGNHWDVWDNVNSHWVSTGIYCGAPAAYTWHHVIVEVERTSGNQLHYIAITLDGSKHYINSYWAPKASSWSGITVNFQMDGNYAEQAYSTWLDKLTLTAW